MKLYFYLIAIFTLITSCEEVINVNLNDSKPALVAEAIIYCDSVCAVKLTSTSNYYSTEKSLLIEDATIILKKDEILLDTLRYNGNGYYIGNTAIGKEGDGYQIEITHNGKSYIATSYMPEKTKIYSINAVRKKINPQKSSKPYGLEIKFRDNPDKEEYYMVHFFVDNKLKNDRYTIIPDMIAVDDTITFNTILRSFGSKEKVEIRVYSVDKSVYTYFKQLNNAIGSVMGLGSSPGNPNTNISSGALGYFAALTYVQDSITIP